MVKNHDNMLSRFHLMPERYRQTEGRTDRQTELLYQYRAIKNVNIGLPRLFRDIGTVVASDSLYNIAVKP